METTVLPQEAATGLEAATTTPRSRGARLRNFIRFDWLPAPESATVPVWVHVLLWAALLGTDALLFYAQSVNPKEKFVPNAAWFARAAVFDMLAALLFYCNWLVLLPRTLAHSRVGLYVCSAVLAVVVYAALRYGASHWVLRSYVAETAVRHSTFQALFSYSVAGIVTLFFSSGVAVTRDYVQVQRNRRELERQHLLTELSLLKMQVNPHFLFNTLNNIFALASQKSDRAPEAVLRLSEIMRYMLYDSNADTVPLAKEVAHLRSFLDLQRLRLPVNAADAIVFEANGVSADAQCPIAPMLLMPLVENAFKHGDLAARPRAVTVQLQAHANGGLHFAVQNYLAAEGRQALDQPGGVGLTNLRRRLELLYPGRYTLTVATPPGEYYVTLTLQSEYLQA